MSAWDWDPVLDETVLEFDIGPYCLRCEHCGAIYKTDPERCQLCGSPDLGPARRDR